MWFEDGVTLLDRVVEDLRDEPSWRPQAAKCEDYFDGNQLDSEYLAQLEERGMHPVSRNMVKAPIRTLLGFEAKNRADFRAFANGDDDTDVAVSLSKWLHEWERRALADRAVSEAHRSQIVAGLGWVEVGRNNDPFGYPHRCWTPQHIEMYPDWRARENDYSDRRYLLRKKWFDRDELMARFPKKRALIKVLGSGEDRWTELPRADFEMLARHFDHDSRTSWEDDEWTDPDRDRLCLHELWYKQAKAGKVLTLPDIELTVEFDPMNYRHVELAEMGLAEVSDAVLPEMRLSFWIGPHRLVDRKSPYLHNEDPYVPFVAFREARTGVPYGLVRDMISPQDEVNSRLTKMLWLLSAKQLVADSDAFVMPPEQVQMEVGRPDAVLWTNPKRINRNHIPKVSSDRELAADQFNVMKDAQGFVAEAGGVYQAMQGRSMPQQSGAAINGLVEQGMTTQGDIGDNYRAARAKVGQHGLSNLIQANMSREFSRTFERERGKKTTIWFNRTTIDEQTGEQLMDNRLDRIRTRVVLEDVASTATFRAQFFTGLSELMKTLPEDMQRILIPYVVESSDLPHKGEIADKLREAMQQQGMTPDQAMAEQQQVALQSQEKEAKILHDTAKAEKASADAERALAEAERARAEIGNVLRQLDMKEAESAQQGADAILQRAMQLAQMGQTRPTAPMVESSPPQREAAQVLPDAGPIPV